MALNENLPKAIESAMQINGNGTGNQSSYDDPGKESWRIPSGDLVKMFGMNVMDVVKLKSIGKSFKAFAHYQIQNFWSLFHLADILCFDPHKSLLIS